MSRRVATTDVFAAIADPTRRAILQHLTAGELPVMALAERFEVTLSAVSQHMRVLGTQIHPSCRTGVFVDQSAESVASVELFWGVRTDEA